MLSVHINKLQKYRFSAFYKLLLLLIQHTQYQHNPSISLQKVSEEGKVNICTLA